MGGVSSVSRGGLLRSLGSGYGRARPNATDDRSWLESQRIPQQRHAQDRGQDLVKTSLLIGCAALVFLGASVLEQTNLLAGGAGGNAAPAASLKPGPGREFVAANCIPCHSTALVAANHMTREQWDKTITTMQQVNGMWPLPAEMRERILDYLENAQRVEDKGLDAGKQSPWATPLYRPNPLWP